MDTQQPQTKLFIFKPLKTFTLKGFTVIISNLQARTEMLQQSCAGEAWTKQVIVSPIISLFSITAHICTKITNISGKLKDIIQTLPTPFSHNTLPEKLGNAQVIFLIESRWPAFIFILIASFVLRFLPEGHFINVNLTDGLIHLYSWELSGP